MPLNKDLNHFLSSSKNMIEGSMLKNLFKKKTITVFALINAFFYIIYRGFI